MDFLIREGTRPVQLIQVAASLHGEATRKRELGSLFKAMKQYKINEGTIVTLGEKEKIRDGQLKIRIVPATEWLLASR